MFVQPYLISQIQYHRSTTPSQIIFFIRTAQTLQWTSAVMSFVFDNNLVTPVIYQADVSMEHYILTRSLPSASSKDAVFLSIPQTANEMTILHIDSAYHLWHLPQTTRLIHQIDVFQCTNWPVIQLIQPINWTINSKINRLIDRAPHICDKHL